MQKARAVTSAFLPQEEKSGDEEEEQAESGDKDVKRRKKRTKPFAGVPCHDGLTGLAVHTKPCSAHTIGDAGHCGDRKQDEEEWGQSPVKMS